MRPGQAASSELEQTSGVRPALDVARELERTLYRQLLELAHEQDVEHLLRSALELIAELACARHGYLELRDPYHPNAPQRWLTFGTPERTGESFQEAISSGVIQRAISSGETVITLSAMTDPRFADRESVQRQEISAVLCVPIGPAPSFGVIYLEGRTVTWPFTDADRERSELCAAQLAILVDRLMLRRRHAEVLDARAALRARLLEAGIVGDSPALHKAVEQLGIVAPLDVTVLITGASGTGKSLFAQALHDNSRRGHGPFVELNCATLPEALLESELFGAERGAHSAASSLRVGKVSAAEGGTLFLDEVAELSVAAQAKLLQLLQSKRYYRLGSNKLETADVRIVAASNRDLEQRVKDGLFREDLYYRLRVFPLHVPALEERPEDIAPLVHHFCARSCSVNGWPPLTLSGAAFSAIQRRRWPGNVRELANALEAAVIRASMEQAAKIEPRHVFPELDRPEAPSGAFHDAVRSFQHDLLKRTLEAADGNVSDAACRLGIARSYLYKLLHAHGLRRDG
jgi:transcriptional regulator with GAF, ATPase, and Fis domain